MKDFLKSPKKTAILGLIGSVIMIFKLPLSAVCLIIYFLLIILRMNKNIGNSKFNNVLLIIIEYTTITINLYEITKYITLSVVDKKLIDSCLIIVIIAYSICSILGTILLRNNYKLYGYKLSRIFFTSPVVSIIAILILIITFVLLNEYFIALGYLFIYPYFHNYKRLIKETYSDKLKEEQKNGK